MSFDDTSTRVHKNGQLEEECVTPIEARSPIIVPIGLEFYIVTRSSSSRPFLCAIGIC